MSSGQHHKVELVQFFVKFNDTSHTFEGDEIGHQRIGKRVVISDLKLRQL